MTYNNFNIIIFIYFNINFFYKFIIYILFKKNYNI